MKVLIVSKTHMNTGVCVGGITFDGRFVRLLDNNGHNHLVIVHLKSTRLMILHS